MAIALEQRARAVLEAAWDPKRGYCYPNRDVYPHLWLWDSCFHAIAWATLGDPRALVELESVLAGQQDGGFVPHMRYAGPTVERGPLDGVSSFTQPPVYAHAAARIAASGQEVAEQTVAAIERALSWLFAQRTNPSGLVRIVHPWEAGSDDSPRWDDWVGASEWNRPEWTQADIRLLGSVHFSPEGAADANPAFEAAPAGFNALAAHAASEVAMLTGKAAWHDRAEELADAIDERLWNEDMGMWSDLAVHGGGPSVHAPTLDGVLPALVTRDEDRAARALARLLDPKRFLGEFGLRYVCGDDHRYRPDQYWRGSSWIQLNYLAALAARRWGRGDIAGSITSRSRRGVAASGFAEHWNPDTGEGYGAIPQTWSALIVAFD